jgi:aldose 1-epimerase
MKSATGQQFSLTLETAKGTWHATVTQLGACLRVLKFNDLELVEGFPEDWPAPYCAGTVMAPWPNRTDGGKWTYEGQVRQFNINIVDQQNANHGLLMDYPYELVQKTDSSVTLSATIFPRAAYPFLVETTVKYELVEGGLTVTHTAVNRSAANAPYGVGGHPYFKFSADSSDNLIFTSNAASVLMTDERQIPTHKAPLAGTEYDSSMGRRLGDFFVDNDFTDLPRDADGLAHTTLTLSPEYLAANAPVENTGLDVWQDANFGHVVFFTPGFYPTPNGLVHTAAIEPATCGPNALNTGDDLLWLKTDELWSGQWGVQLLH